MSKQAQVVISSVQSAPIENNFSLSQTIQSIRKQWKDLNQSLCQSQTYKAYQQYRKTFGNEVCKPVSQVYNNTYNQLPKQTTKLKFNYINDYTFKQRLIFLNVFAIGGALLTLRGVGFSSAWGKSFRAVRNASLMYVFGGLLVAPEIYNPLMNQ